MKHSELEADLLGYSKGMFAWYSGEITPQSMEEN